MNNYSNSSASNLATADKDLQILFREVLNHFDHTILYGNRSLELQLELYGKGRLLVNNHWIISDSKKIVTYCDGVVKKSKHNYSPSKAVDALPYPINGKDKERMYYFAGIVIGIAKKLKAEGKITNDVTWGGDWDGDTEVRDQTFMDLAHFEIK